MIENLNGFIFRRINKNELKQDAGVKKQADIKAKLTTKQTQNPTKTTNKNISEFILKNDGEIINRTNVRNTAVKRTKVVKRRVVSQKLQQSKTDENKMIKKADEINFKKSDLDIKRPRVNKDGNKEIKKDQKMEVNGFVFKIMSNNKTNKDRNKINSVIHNKNNNHNKMVDTNEHKQDKINEDLKRQNINTDSTSKTKDIKDEGYVNQNITHKQAMNDLANDNYNSNIVKEIINTKTEMLESLKDKKTNKSSKPDFEMTENFKIQIENNEKENLKPNLNDIVLIKKTSTENDITHNKNELKVIEDNTPIITNDVFREDINRLQNNENSHNNDAYNITSPLEKTQKIVTPVPSNSINSDIYSENGVFESKTTRDLVLKTPTKYKSLTQSLKKPTPYNFNKDDFNLIDKTPLRKSIARNSLLMKRSNEEYFVPENLPINLQIKYLLRKIYENEGIFDINIRNAIDNLDYIPIDAVEEYENYIKEFSNEQVEIENEILKWNRLAEKTINDSCLVIGERNYEHEIIDFIKSEDNKGENEINIYKEYIEEKFKALDVRKKELIDEITDINEKSDTVVKKVCEILGYKKSLNADVLLKAMSRM